MRRDSRFRVECLSGRYGACCLDGTRAGTVRRAGHPVSRVSRRVLNGSWTVTDQDLQDAFSEAGKVDSSQVIIDRATNRSRGFGFVEMASDDAAEAAIKKLNGRDIKGRPIRVNEAQARSGNDRE